MQCMFQVNIFLLQTLILSTLLDIDQYHNIYFSLPFLVHKPNAAQVTKHILNVIAHIFIAAHLQQLFSVLGTWIRINSPLTETSVSQECLLWTYFVGKCCPLYSCKQKPTVYRTELSKGT